MTKNTWPAFVWTVLKNGKVREIYGESIWQFIPQQWRYWWIETLKTKYPHVFGEVTIENPPPIFVDRTPELSEWKDDMDSQLLSRIASSCNIHLLPKNLCPWGCSEFDHKVGYLDFDIVW